MPHARGALVLLALLARQDPDGGIRAPAAWRAVPVRVTSGTHALRLRTPSGTVGVPIAALHEGHGPTTARVLGAWRDHAGTVVLLDTRAQSRGPGAEMGYCGAGEERAVAWLDIRRGVVRRQEVVVYASCLRTVEGDVAADADSLWGTVDAYADSTHRTFVFRRAQLLGGLHVRDSMLTLR